MRAATIRDGRIVVADHPDPEPGHGEVLVRVHAAGLNNADLLQVAGGYPAPPGSPQDIPGLELAGEVAALGPNATRFSLGDRVMAVVGGGGQAELAVVHERLLTPVPTPMPWEQAGGFPEAYTTAHDALFTQCQLKMGERLCVHGAAGGVGTAAVQLGVATGAVVTATVRNPSRRADVAALGAEVISPEDFLAAPATAGDEGYDVVIELVSGANMAANLRQLTTGGRITVIGLGTTPTAEIELHTLMFKRARIHGSTLRTRPLEGKAMAARAVEDQVLPVVQAGRITVPLAGLYPLDEAADAYERFAAGGKFGKIVITMR